MEKCLITAFVFTASALALAPRGPIINPRIDWRIIGGQIAPEGAFPYIVSVRYRDIHSCGATIIHHEWVVTAATCVLGRPEASLSIVAGSNWLSFGGTKYAVIAAYPHEKYDPKTDQNNVAILRVKRINFTPKVGAIAVEREDVKENEICTLSGWGFTSSPGANSDSLRYINLKTTTNKICANANQGQGPITASQICTFTRSGEGSCSGDTGGPLVRTIRGISKLIGIVNWMIYPCGTGKPDVYSRVSSYYDWFRIKCNCI